MSSQKDQERWAYYPLYLRDRDGSCLVNLGAPEADPTPQPIRLTLTFQVEPSDDNRFGSSAERAELEKLIEAFDAALKRSCQGIWAGQLREPGSLLACFYCVNAPTESVRRELERPLAAKSFTIDITEDPDWQYYFEELMPTPLASEWMRNERVEAALRRDGDPLNVSREIEHWAYFADAESAHSFILTISADNFVASDPEHQTGENARENQSWCVRFKRDDLPTADELAPITLHLQETAEQLHGEYDGWETCVLKD